MKAKQLDKKFDSGEDITKYLEVSCWTHVNVSWVTSAACKSREIPIVDQLSFRSLDPPDDQ